MPVSAEMKVQKLTCLCGRETELFLTVLPTPSVQSRSFLVDLSDTTPDLSDTTPFAFVHGDSHEFHFRTQTVEPVSRVSAKHD